MAKAKKLTEQEKAKRDLPAGWTCPGASKKWHYFCGGSLTSLCGKWMYAGVRENSNHDSADNCAECKRRRAKNIADQTADAAKPRPKPVPPAETFDGFDAAALGILDE